MLAVVEQTKAWSLPQTHASSEATGADLNAEGEPMTIDALLRHRANERSPFPVVSYPTDGIDYQDYTANQLDNFAYTEAVRLAPTIPVRMSSRQKPSVVALLGPSNLDYLVTILALSKLGHTILFLSTRISTAAYVNLFQSTAANHLLVHSSFEEKAREILHEVPHLQVQSIGLEAEYKVRSQTPVSTKVDNALDAKVEAKNIAFIIHSSGSTGLPKPIYQTHESAIKNYAQNMGMKAFITLPLYHNHGLSNLFRAIYSRKQIHLYNAVLPLTSTYLLQIMSKFEFEIFYGVPFALKLLAESDDGLKVLSKMKVVMYGGSACPDLLGDKLVQNGVNLVSHYGATEVGQLMTSFRPSGDLAWNYVRVSAALKPFLKWIPHGNGLYEACVLEGWPAKVASNMEDGSYATKDLFVKHPDLADAWKYVSRRDDTLVLVQGEKVNPVGVEGAIRSHRLVAEAVVFGAGKAMLGVMVIPSAESQTMTDPQLHDEIWAAVKETNADVDSFARISRDMVKILPVGTEYPSTDKGSCIRAAFYKQFDQEIEQAYEELASGNLLVLDKTGIEAFLFEQLQDVLPEKSNSFLKADSDLFTLGMDSVQAIVMRNRIIRNLDIGNNVLSETKNDSVSVQSVEEEMQALIEKYGTFDSRAAGKCTTEKPRCLLLTGATGSLGAHILSQLLQEDSVVQVYCLVRATDKLDANQRVFSSLVARGLGCSKVIGSNKLVCLPSDFSKPSFGLEQEVYKTLAANVSSVIHCAWSVNFQLALRSFEDCIAGVRHFADLCSLNGASLDFCSSVSAVARSPAQPVPEGLPETLEAAQSMGYARSKLVAEHICVRAAEQAGITARVLRVGQVVADTKNGIWNATEAIPLMMQCAETIGALPTLDEEPHWMPVDQVAAAIKDISLSDALPGSVAHIVNPHAFHWTGDLLPALRAAGLSFEELPQRQWIQRLRESNQDPVANPPIKLVNFFASKYDNDRQRTPGSHETKEACKWSLAMRSASRIDQAAVDRFVQYFKRECW